MKKCLLLLLALVILPAAPYRTRPRSERPEMPRAAADNIPHYAASFSQHSVQISQRDPSAEGAASGKGDWFSQVQRNIAKAEYNISYQEKCAVEGMPGGLHVANRANNLRAYFREDGVQIMERETAAHDWELEIQLTGCGAGDAVQALPPVAPAIEGNRVTYTYSAGQASYSNDERGLAFAFTVNNGPADSGTMTLRAKVGGLTPAVSRDGGIAFNEPDGGEVLRLANVVAEDAAGTVLPLTLGADSGHVEFRIATPNAANPITVKGLYVPPPPGSSSYHFRLVSQLESNQAYADLGESVAGAGDVNGDGYADVLVGVPWYDNGETREGTAFLFLGSASGLVGTSPGSAAAALESNQGGAEFGGSVSGVGDANGDGYADVIIGAYGYDRDQQDEGAAFLFLGSASGLVGADPSSAAAILESNQARAYFGYSVTGAGDVNGDGYADVLVGAHWYDNGEEDEGAVFLFLGSASGLVGRSPGSAAAVLESNQFGAYFGY
ncbi:MAG: FG-GAP repeat protein, partial [Candidatus Hydrogenedentes bacterium]|nr:FG-GAP repeat protein [Candidatus Hydrogenedentota bacterium]